MTTNQDQAQAHPPSWGDVFGEDPGPSMITDEPHGAAPRSSASIMAARRRSQDQAAKQARDLDLIEKTAQDEADDLALAEATRLTRAGKPIPPATAARAARAARARGTTMTSAERLAAQAQAAGGGH